MAGNSTKFAKCYTIMKDKLFYYFVYNILYLVIFSFYVRLLFFTFTSIFKVHIYSWIIGLNFAISLLLGIFLILFPIFLFLIITIKYENCHQNKFRWISKYCSTTLKSIFLKHSSLKIFSRKHCILFKVAKHIISASSFIIF